MRREHRTWRRTVAAAALFALATGCTASPGSSTTSASPSPAAAPSVTTAPGAAASGAAASAIRVPDAFTAVTVRSLSAPTYPFKGTDGRYHIAYDLELTNAQGVPATVERIDVVDASSPSTVIDSLSGTRLVDPDCSFGDCSRLRLLPQAPADSTVIPPQESRVVFVDFALDSPDQFPKAVAHHLYGQAAQNPGSTEPGPVDYLAAPFDISAGTPPVIGPPVKGDRWVALNGCCLPGFPHRTSMATLNGLLVNSQRFAIDWKQANESGAFYEGDKTSNESYFDYGAEVIAVADGTITSTLDRLDPNTPGVLPADDPVLRAQLTVETVDGNNIVQDIGGGVYAFYAHLQKGSLLVRPGDTVKKGQVIARLGNTGNSNAAHLHLHLMNGPSVLGSDGVPYVIDSFEYDGQVAVEQLQEADNYVSGTYLSGRLPTPEPRTEELPLLLAIVNFPG